MNQDIIMQKKEDMSAFLQNLETRFAQEEQLERFRNSKANKMRCLQKAQTDAKETCAKTVVCKLYKDSLPASEEYKCANDKELDTSFVQFLNGKGKNGVYAYIVEKAGCGSKPAASIMESVNDMVKSYYAPFYENLDEVDPDDVEMNMDDEGTSAKLQEVTAKMGFDEVSKIIEDNVRDTIRKEGERAKGDDDLIKEIQSSLEQDDNAVTESAIDAAFLAHGVRRKPYQPSLFDGIMINKMNRIKDFSESSALDGVHQQKQAFVEAVQEYTMWEVLTTLDMERMNQDQVDILARRYAVGKI